MLKLVLGLLAMAWAGAAAAQPDYAGQLKEGDVALRDFRFASGERWPGSGSIIRRSALRGGIPEAR